MHTWTCADAVHASSTETTWGLVRRADAQSPPGTLTRISGPARSVLWLLSSPGDADSVSNLRCLHLAVRRQRSPDPHSKRENCSVFESRVGWKMDCSRRQKESRLPGAPGSSSNRRHPCEQQVQIRGLAHPSTSLSLLLALGKPLPSTPLLCSLLS